MAWTLEDMVELGTRHAELEARRDLEGTLATLVPDPVYELLPVGRKLSGMQQVLRYYEHLFSSFIPSTRSYRLLEQWANEHSVAQEYEIEVDVGGALERHRVVGILFASGGLLGGERVYGSERVLRLMAGDALFDELPPL